MSLAFRHRFPQFVGNSVCQTAQWTNHKPVAPDRSVWVESDRPSGDWKIDFSSPVHRHVKASGSPSGVGLHRSGQPFCFQ